MGEVWTTTKALVFIAKAIINAIMLISGMIKKHEFEKNMRQMADDIEKASSGELQGRVEAGSRIEDRINERAP